ncbi:hypothetical protein SH661x_000163 [Planctomicrobium sp. SH661]|uniref:hypothetical protein n=1 Tax=Planctomicrobium sp. SH661 TaxID=3448124 RepID=UPI003F5BF7B0
MIIPTPEFDPFFAQDGVPFREKMNAYIQREFADLLPEAMLTEAEDAPIVHMQSESDQNIPADSPGRRVA